VLVFFLIRSALAYSRGRPKIIRTYLCANYLNRGKKDEEMAGEIQHNRGRLLSGREELDKLALKSEVWEYTKDTVHGGNGSCVFYGPYSTDCSEPGVYSATFVVRGVGLSRPSELQGDYILLEFDVSKKLPQFVGLEKGVRAFEFDTKMCRHFVKVSDLAKGGWQKFELFFYADGLGSWEYRCFAFDGLDARPDNIGKLGEGVRVLFDRVIIKKVNKFEFPDA